MKRFFWGLLLVAGAAAAAASPVTVALPQEGLSSEQAARLGVDLYNRKAGENVTFQLLKADPQPEWDASSQSAQEVNFTIQEIECLADENHLEEEQCNIRDEGLVKECSGYFFLDEMPAVAVVSCDEATDEPEAKRVKRAFGKKFKKFLKKTKNKFEGLFKHGTVIVAGSIPLAG